MVIKGKQRSGARNLAKHLARVDTNEVAELVELRGVAATRLMGALCEMEAVAAGTRCKQALYHAMINTHPQEPLTPDQWSLAVDRLEDGLRLTGQPRAIVRHIKDGREHLHVVWSRIDMERMTAIHLGHNYRTHELVSRDLEREFGHRVVKGVHTGNKAEARPVAALLHHEHQQGERRGLPARDIGADLTAAWQSTDTGRAFAEAIEAKGYVLARGDRRDLVVMDQAGTAHSPRRRIEGARAADIKARFADIDPQTLPSVKEVRAQLKEKQLVSAEEQRRPGLPETKPAPPKELAEPPVEPGATDEGDEDSGGIIRTISRLFRRWTSKAGSFLQSWNDRLIRAFNSGFEIEPEKSPAVTGGSDKPAREEYKPGSYKPTSEERDRDDEKDREDDR